MHDFEQRRGGEDAARNRKNVPQTGKADTERWRRQVEDNYFFKNNK